MDIILEARGASFGYGGVPILKRLCLAIRRGEMVGVIGPNGGGKSTLVRGLSRVLPPLEGEVRLDDVNLARVRRGELARRLAVVPQSANLPSLFTVQEVVLMGRTPYLGLLGAEKPRDRQIAEQAMRLTHTLELAERRVGDLSGGERQRVVVARALAQEPEVLLLDEPTAHLDIAHQLGLLNLLKKLNSQQGLTVLSVFHDLNLAAQYCERLLLLADGTILAEGSPEDVITPANIHRAYGAEVQVFSHPLNQRPVTLLCPPNGKAMGAAESVPASSLDRETADVSQTRWWRSDTHKEGCN